MYTVYTSERRGMKYTWETLVMTDEGRLYFLLARRIYPSFTGTTSLLALQFKNSFWYITIYVFSSFKFLNICLFQCCQNNI